MIALVCLVMATVPAPAELLPPTLVESVAPVYPDVARQAGVSGKVTLGLDVDAAGVVTRVVVDSAPTPELGESAAAAARAFRFTPARLADVPVGVHITYEIVFTLSGTLEIEVVDPGGAPLLGVALTVGERLLQVNERITLTNSPGGQTRLALTAPGFRPAERSVDVRPGEVTHLVIVMEPLDLAGYETRIVTRQVRDEVTRAPLALDATPTVSHYQLTRRDIELNVGSLEDLSRTLQSLPGVVADPGLLATFFVRGGGSDEVVFYLDGMPIANPFHLGGFASFFNPELVQGVEFYSGCQPAPSRSSLSGAVDVSYARGNPERLEATADVSMNTAKVWASGPIPGLPHASFLVAARRSYFEAYFAALRAVHVVGSDFAAPELGEYVAKTDWQDGAHSAGLSLIYATDGLSFASRPGERSLISFDGSLEIENRLTLVSGRYRYAPSERLAMSAVAGYLRDVSTNERKGGDAAGAVLNSGDTRLGEAVGRADLELRPFGKNLLRTGLELTQASRRFSGIVVDTRTLPRWAFMPVADYGLPRLAVRPRTARRSVALYLEDEWADIGGRVTPRIGLRAELPSDAEALLSPRLAVSVRAWPGGVVKASAGIYPQRAVDPLALDPTYGNPRLRPEVTRIAVLGIDQLLPFGALGRLEAYYKDLRDLVVSTGDGFHNAGHGYANGIDVAVFYRTPRYGAGLSYGFLKTERVDPLSTAYAKRYAPSQDQRHTLGASFDMKLDETWSFAARYQFHTGRPYTPIERFVVIARDGEPAWQPVLGKIDDARRRPFHELSLRAEYWIRGAGYRATLYAEVLNVTNTMQTFVDTYDDGDAASGKLPVRGAIQTLPIRPFLGARIEY